MNRRTFIVALLVIAAGALVVTARNGEDRPTGVRTRPAGHRAEESTRLAPERIATLLDQMSAEQPDVHKHLLRLRDENPQAFKRAMSGINRFVRRLGDLPPELKQKMIQQRSDRVERYRLVKRYHATTDLEHRQTLRDDIRQLTGRLFDADLAMKEFRIRQLSQELAELKTELADRAGRRDELVDRGLQRALRPRTRPAR